MLLFLLLLSLSLSLVSLLLLSFFFFFLLPNFPSSQSSLEKAIEKKSRALEAQQLVILLQLVYYF